MVLQVSTLKINTMNQILTFFTSLTIGKKFLLFLTPFISILLGMKTLLFASCILITIDLFTGIIKSFKEKEIKFNLFKKETYLVIKSGLLRLTLKKSYEYGLLLIVVAIIESFILGLTPIMLIGKVFTLTELSIVIPCGIEVWSIFENIESITGNNILKKFISFLPKKLQNLFSKEMIKEEQIEDYEDSNNL